MTPRRKWLFRLAALVVPLLALAVLEGVLRLAGYGYPTRFFERVRVGGQEFFVNNEQFSLRFFPPQLARSPGPIMMAATKPTNTCRIFVLGESAARGEPEPPYAASRYLEALLNERYPAERFEVVNLAITAINSHVILPIARDCARQQGDLWIIYMGNNEMVGPFGAATVFGAKAPPLPIVRLSLAIQQTRIGQWLMAISRKLRGNAANSSWGGMKMFLGNQLAPDDPRKEIVYRNFQRNLQDIVRVGLDSGAKILLSTVAVNLKDCPPFASLSDTNLPTADVLACDKLCADGARAQEQGRFQEAAQYFEQAARLDAKRPELQFRWGECLLRLTNFAAARECFQRACDDDALLFRADSRINGAIAATGRQLAGKGLVLFDATAALQTNTPTGICGEELFYEHVHFNFDGNYRLGLAWASQVESLLPARIKAQAVGEWVSQETCERWLGLTDWNRGAVVQSVIERLHRPPLSGQLNNDRRLASLEAQQKERRQQINAATIAAAREVYTAAIRRVPGDHFLHENYAEFLESIGESRQALIPWQQVRALLPRNAFAHYQAGRLLAQQGSWVEAETALRQAVLLRPGLSEAWFELGSAQFQQNQLELARQSYERAHRLDPQDPTFCAFLGKVLSKLNRRAEAIQRYREALQLRPDFAEAHFALASELAADSLLAEAASHFVEVTRLQPTNVLAHLNAGVLLARQGQFDAALRQLAEAQRLEPGNPTAQEYLTRVRSWKSRKQ